MSGSSPPFHAVYAVDTRGHGRFPRGTAPFTLGQFAEDLRALMDDEEGLSHTYHLGFSDGGNIAPLFALRYPERVERLILCGANLRPTGMTVPCLLSTWGTYLVAALLAPFSSGQRRQKELLALMVREPHISPAALQSLPTPTLVLAGTKDLIR